MFILSIIQIINQGLFVGNIKKNIYQFGSTIIAKSRGKHKYMYSGYGIVFVGVGSGGFVDGAAKNTIVFGVGNSSSSHIINRKKKKKIR